VTTGPTWWEILSLLGVWAAAGATFYAARTALSIARQQQAISLEPSVETSHAFPASGEQIPFIGFSVRNNGFWAATVSGFSFEHALYKGSYFVTDYDWVMGEKLPCRIEHAEEKTFVAAKGITHKQWISDLGKSLFDNRNRLARWYICRTLRVTTKAGNGQVFKAKPGKQFSSLLRKASREMKKGEPS